MTELQRYLAGYSGVLSTDVTDRLLVPDGFARPDQPAGPPAVTETVSNLGAGQQQDVIHAPHTLERAVYAQTVLEASVSMPLLSAVSRIDMAGRLVNYLILSPSGGGQTLYVSLSGDIAWQKIGSVYYPIADIIVPSGSGSIYVSLPARENWTLFLIAWTNPLGFTADAGHVLYGYQPHGRDRLVLE